MAKPAPNLGVSKPKPDLSAMRSALRETAAPATHAEAPPSVAEETAPRRRKAASKTQLVGAHLSPDVGRQLRIIAAEEGTDVKALLIEAINLLFKTRGKPQIATDPVKR